MNAYSLVWPTYAPPQHTQTKTQNWYFCQWIHYNFNGEFLLKLDLVLAFTGVVLPAHS